MENDKFLEKEIQKYVIATLSNPTLYMKKVYQKTQYIFTKDIEAATKYMSKDVAAMMVEYYKKDTGDNMDLVIIPVSISYSLIKE